MEELWQVIPEFDDYAISSKGRVMRLTSGTGTWPGRLIKPKIHTGGYLQVSLNRNAKTNYRFIHRLVLETFLGEFPKGTETNHKNHNRKDNRLENLEYLSSFENARHLGNDNGNSKLTGEEVLLMRRLRKKGIKSCDLAEIFSISPTHVSYICCRKNWKHI